MYPIVRRATVATAVAAMVTLTGAGGASPWAEAASSLAGTWRLLPAAPVTKAPQVQVAVWTGKQMIIHGDYPSATMAYRPSTGRWAKLRTGPKPLNLEATDVAVWTGSRMLVMGLTNGSFNPVTNTWRPIARLILPDEAAVTAWTGHQAIIWGGVCCDDISNNGEAYNPATNHWRMLPAAPLQPRRSAAGAWTGKELLVAGGAAGEHKSYRDGAAYNPATNRWRKIAPMPASRTGAAGVWDGTELLVIGGWVGSGSSARLARAALAYKPATNRWRWLASMAYPRDAFAAVWTGHQVLVWGGFTTGHVIPPHGEAYAPAANRWSALPKAPLRGRGYPTAVWTGRRMIVWGGEGRTDGAAFTPS